MTVDEIAGGEDYWTEEFTFDEVALALAQFAISRGSRLPYSYNMDEPAFTMLSDGPNYMRLRYAPKGRSVAAVLERGMEG